MCADADAAEEEGDEDAQDAAAPRRRRQLDRHFSGGDFEIRVSKKVFWVSQLAASRL